MSRLGILGFRGIFLANTAWLWYTYNKGLLSQVRRDTNVTQYYNLAYDDFGNMTSVKVGSKTLATYEYDSRNRLVKQTYGNGQAVTFTYDAYDRIKTATYPDGRILTYSYNGDGAVHSMVEKNGDSPASYVYEYDSLGRLITSEKLENQFELGKSLMYNSQGYDENNRLVFESWKYPDDLTFTNRYGYDDNNGTMVGVDIRNDHATLTYDSLLRLSTFNTGGVGSKNYTYREITSGAKNTNQVTQLSYPSLKNGYHFKYGYDQAGNISSYELTCAAGASYSEAPFSYIYDNQGQLLRATDGTDTYVYTYDGAGNILTSNKKGTAHSYTYGDSNWRDLLTAYDGQSITYDGAGNPTSYYNGTRWTFTWGNGRRLETASGNGNNVSYAYDANGLRTSKTVNGVVHTYYYSGGLLRRETYGDTVLDFFYDANGTPYSMLQNRGAMYYYITNLQGDVIRLVNSSGQTAAYYEYDPYGNAIKAAGSHCEINPLRYRGYVYDTETGLYYCQSRYYDPAIGRFINADEYSSSGQGIIGNNMFAYCGNNPISRRDSAGDVWHIVAGAVAGAAAGALTKMVTNMISGDSFTKGLATATIAGAVSGGLAASGVGLAGQVLGNAAISMVNNAVDQFRENREQPGANSFDVGSMLVDGAIGAIAGLAGGAGAGNKGLTNMGLRHIRNAGKAFLEKGANVATKVWVNGAYYFGKNARHVVIPVAKALRNSSLAVIGGAFAKRLAAQERRLAF